MFLIWEPARVLRCFRRARCVCVFSSGSFWTTSARMSFTWSRLRPAPRVSPEIKPCVSKPCDHQWPQNIRPKLQAWNLYIGGMRLCLSAPVVTQGWLWWRMTMAEILMVIEAVVVMAVRCGGINGGVGVEITKAGLWILNLSHFADINRFISWSQNWNPVQSPSQDPRDAICHSQELDFRALFQTHTMVTAASHCH